MVNLQKLDGKLNSNVLAELDKTVIRFNLQDPLVLSHFLAQTAHESAGFTRTVENLNYSAVRLLQVFPKYFDGSNAEEYAGNPAAIASRVYADRMGNGPEDSTEGWVYRGRGYLQLTGRVNYQAFNAVTKEDIMVRPELVSTKYPMLSAGWFWRSNGLNGLAMQGDTPGIVEAVTKKVNGGKNGLDDRIKRFEYFYGLLKDGAIPNEVEGGAATE